MECKDVSIEMCTAKGYPCHCNMCENKSNYQGVCAITKLNTCPIFGCPKHPLPTAEPEPTAPVLYLVYGGDNSTTAPSSAYLVYGLNDPMHLENILEEHDRDVCLNCEGNACNTCHCKDAKAHIKHLVNLGHTVIPISGVVIKDGDDNAMAYKCLDSGGEEDE